MPISPKTARYARYRYVIKLSQMPESSQNIVDVAHRPTSDLNSGRAFQLFKSLYIFNFSNGNFRRPLCLKVCKSVNPFIILKLEVYVISVWKYCVYRFYFGKLAFAVVCIQLWAVLSTPPHYSNFEIAMDVVTHRDLIDGQCRLYLMLSSVLL